MSRDDLRAFLEKIAATAGDPPEHGLDGVAARRRRRTRHRRGAVATAMALAFLSVAIYPRIDWLGDDHDVTVTETGERSRPAELPDVVEVHCTRDGIEVPVASIQPQDDGLHVDVQNSLGYPTEVWVTSDDGWDSGRIEVSPGSRQLRQPVPPGVLTVGCQVGAEDQQRRVDLVDVDGLYEVPELSCGLDERHELPPRAIDPPAASYHEATVEALTTAGARGEFEVQPRDGYPTPRFGDSTRDPVVQAVQDGDTVAFVYLVGQDTTEDGPADPPWDAVSRLEVCTSFVAPSDSAGGATPSA